MRAEVGAEVVCRGRGDVRSWKSPSAVWSIEGTLACVRSGRRKARRSAGTIHADVGTGVDCAEREVFVTRDEAENVLVLGSTAA